MVLVAFVLDWIEVFLRIPSGVDYKGGVWVTRGFGLTRGVEVV